MKMLMIICPTERQEEIRALIDRHGVHGYTEIEEVLGEGKTGKKLDTHVWPGKSSLIFTVTSPEKEEELVKALRHSAEHLYPGEGLRAFVLPVESVI